MAIKVPTYERQVSKIAPNVSTKRELRPPEDVFGGKTAQANQRLGETAMRIGEALALRGIERQREIMAKQVTDQDTAFRQEMQNVLYNEQADKKGRPLGFLSRKLEQAQGSIPEFDSIYTGIKNKYLSNVPAAEQKEALGRLLDSSYLSHRDTIIRHERQQTDESIQNSFNSNLEIQVNEAARLQDGPSVIRAIDSAVATQGELSRINGYDAKTIEAKKIEITGKVAKSAFAAAADEKNLIKAQSIYNAVKGKIPAETEEKMKEQVESGIPYAISIQDAFLDPISTRQKLEKNAYNIKDPVKRKAAYDFTNTLAEQMISDSQETRHNELLDKLSQGKLALVDIENELQVPEEQGGLKKKMLVNYQTALQRGIERDLNRMLQEKTPDKEPTKRAQQVKEYNDLIEAFINEDTDKWHAREKLSQAYADGIVNSTEAKFLDTLKTNLKDIEFNRSSGPLVNTVKAVKSWLHNNNASDEEITRRIKQLLGTLSQEGTVPQDAAKAIMQDHINSKIPELATFSPKGQLMMDAYGNKAMVYPDGTIEPVVTYKEKEQKAQ